MYTPWFFAIAFAVVILMGRWLSNRSILRMGIIPLWVSAVYMVGFLGMVACFFWSFLIAWWAPSVVLLLYFLIQILMRSFAVEVASQTEGGSWPTVLAAAQQAADEMKNMPSEQRNVNDLSNRVADILEIPESERHHNGQ